MTAASKQIIAKAWKKPTICTLETKHRIIQFMVQSKIKATLLDRISKHLNICQPWTDHYLHSNFDQLCLEPSFFALWNKWANLWLLEYRTPLDLWVTPNPTPPFSLQYFPYFFLLFLSLTFSRLILVTSIIEACYQSLRTETSGAVQRIIFPDKRGNCVCCLTLNDVYAKSVKHHLYIWYKL